MKWVVFFLLAVASISFANSPFSVKHAPPIMSNELIQLHFAKAQDVEKLIIKTRSLLSGGGHIAADVRTNSLWVQDIKINVNHIKKFIKQIDIPTKQVLIKAKIVNIDTSALRELGVQFNTTPSGIINMQNSNILVLPVAKIGGVSILNLQLSALEQQGKAQILSSPKLMTANHQTAYIEAGDEIPYQEKTKQGDTSVAFKKAVMSLKVTPVITPEKKVLLSLVVSQDKVSELNINGVPAISTREIKTQVLANNQQTIALGGIYEIIRRRQQQRVPVLGAIPLLGALFRRRQIEYQRRELLIFVTPLIVS